MKFILMHQTTKPTGLTYCLSLLALPYLGLECRCVCCRFTKWCQRYLHITTILIIMPCLVVLVGCGVLVLFCLFWYGFFFFLRGEVGAGAMGWWHVEWGFLSPVLSKLSSGQDDSPCKLPFLSYSKGTDLATNIHPPTIMTPQQTNMVCPEQYSRQGEKTPEAKNAFCFQEYRACTGKQTG